MLVSADLAGPAPRSPEGRYANIELNMRTQGIYRSTDLLLSAEPEHKYLHLAAASVFIPAADNRSMAGRLLGSWTPCKQSPALLLIRDSEGSQNNILPIYIYTATVAREQDGSGEGEALTGASDSTRQQSIS